MGEGRAWGGRGGEGKGREGRQGMERGREKEGEGVGRKGEGKGRRRGTRTPQKSLATGLDVHEHWMMRIKMMGL